MLLAIDTSTRMIGVALYDGVQIVSEMVWLSQQYHTVELAPTVDSLMERAGIPPSELQVVAVALGPGSFTGLRIGLAFAKGMALANHMEIIGVPTLDILAASQPIDELPLAAVLHAGRGRLAVGRYKNSSGSWKSDDQVKVQTSREVAAGIKSPTIVCGELTAEEQRIFRRKRKNVILYSPAQCLRRPSFLAELGWRRWRKGLTDDPASLTPIYLHYEQKNSG
ncbi:MAG: tRNA (adenosine(37)-N6)-threonylcarbamoyltransferase complex dimerization subunit type 1 TsaB [Anaerolineales bacterium]|nr:tRNA (adenosine(37)-N6)-threonylcarbamoyltransferase complex dimerization subunit type 1 TsaB [Anaerolineales bacterium]